MTKKDYIINVLLWVEPYWEWAREIIHAVQTQDLDEETLDMIEKEITKAVDETVDEQTKAKMQQSINKVKQLQELEAKEREKEEKELDDMDKMISSL